MATHATNMPTSTLVIGIGNAWRGDDAAGLLVAHALLARGLLRDSVREAASVGPELMDAWRDADRVILVDAVVSGQAPGTVHRFDVHCQSLPADLVSCSTHSFDLAGIIDLARVLDRLPPNLIIYGIEAQSFENGQAVTPAVMHGLAACTDAILDELARSER